MPITLKQFIDKYKGKKLDWDKAYQGQCVDLFRFYNHEVLNISQPKGVVGAADFWANYDSDPILKDNFTQIKNTADFKPLEGDVMIWNKRAGGGFGHIAVVSDNSADLNNFNSFDQNWRALNVSEITKHTYSNVYGVLRPVEKSVEIVDNSALEACMIDRKKFWNERDAEIEAHKHTKENHLAFVNRLADIYGSVHSEESVIKFASENCKVIDERNELKVSLGKERQARKQDVLDHQDELSKLKKEIKELSNEVTSANLLNERLTNKLENLTKQIESRIKETDDAQKKIEDSESELVLGIWASFKMWIKKLLKREKI